MLFYDIRSGTMATSYSIGKHFEDMIEDLLESGRYSTASEIMREGLRLVEEREERRRVKLEALRAEIQKGFDSGPMEEVDLSEWMESIKQRGRQRLAARKRGE
jgi:antitoxin ParD1/3/4